MAMSGRAVRLARARLARALALHSPTQPMAMERRLEGEACRAVSMRGAW
jgi:hypothetical protein